MKEFVNSSNYLTFLERFYEFCDAVFRSIELKLNNGTREVNLFISARDSKSIENDGWVCVAISLESVSEVRVYDEKQKQPIDVISHGLHLMVLEDVIGIEFGGAIDPLNSVSELRNSTAYAIGEKMSYEVFPY